MCPLGHDLMASAPCAVRWWLLEGEIGARRLLAESLMALASLAGQTVVTAAVTDAWEAARRGFTHLLGRGDPCRASLAERRLAETRQQLTKAAGADLERTRAALEAQWVTRLADLLEEDPGTETDLRALVEQVQALLPAAVLSASDHSLAAAGDVNISATSGGIAAGVIDGNVAPPGPTGPGPATA